MDINAVGEIRWNPSVVRAWLNAGEVEPLLEVLLEPRAPVGVRIVIMNEVTELGDQRFVPALVQLLSDGSAGIRGRAAITLGFCALKGMLADEAAPALLRCVEDEDDYVQMESLIALSHLGERRAIPALLELAETSPVTDYRGTAVAALGRLGAPEAEGYFIRYLRSRDRADAAWAATWLAEIGTEASIKPLRMAARLARLNRANRKDYRDAIDAIETRASPAGT